MGGIVRGLFGGGKNTSQSQSQSTSESGNNAFDMIKSALSGNITGGNNAFNTMLSALGVGGDGGAAGNAALDTYKDSSGYNFLLDSGSKAITGNAAARGLLNSGATLKALTGFGQDLASTKYDNWLNQLSGATNTGLNAAQIISGAGQYSKGQSTSTGTSKGTNTGGIIPGLFG